MNRTTVNIVDDGGLLTRLTDAMARGRVLVLGDVMLDSYIYGKVERISQEAPIPVLSQQGDAVFRPGGAANVASNILALGGQVALAGLVGDDTAADNLERVLQARAAHCKQPDHYQSLLLRDNKRATTQKTRYIAQHQQILRLDREQVSAPDKAISDALLSWVEQQLPTVGAVIISDYGKGLLTNGLLAKLLTMARRHGVVVVVDPKGKDFGKYRGASYVTPNRQELSDVSRHVQPLQTNDDIIAAARDIMVRDGIGAVLATRSEEGLSLIEESSVVHFHTDAREVFDVAGAGDTVVAVFASCLAAGLPPIFASRLANAGGGVVVGKSGAADASLSEMVTLLQLSLTTNKKLMTLENALVEVAASRAAGKKIVVANGCFDLLHHGHVSLLNEARTQGDELLVLMNSDRSVQALKGAGRPFQSALLRADGLAALPSVSWVVEFDAATPADAINQLKPDVLVKGEDYKDKEVVGSAVAGRIHLVKLQAGISTSGIIKSLDRGLDRGLGKGLGH